MPLTIKHPNTPQNNKQAVSLEQLESGAAASAAEAASLRGQLSAKAAALREHKVAEEALAQRLRSAEAQLQELRSTHAALQQAQGALQAAHAEQSTALRSRLAAAQQRLSEVLAGQEGLAAAAAAQQQQLEGELAEQAAEVAALRQERQQLEHEAAVYKGKYQAVQHANDSLRVKIMSSPGNGGNGGNPKALPVLSAPPLPSPGFRAGPPISPGCRVTAAAAATDLKASPRSSSPVGSTIPAVKAHHPSSPAAAAASPRQPANTTVSFTSLTVSQRGGGPTGE